MRRSQILLNVLVLGCLGAVNSQILPAASSLTQHGITWKFDKDYPTGQFVTGDHWVVGPVTIVEITTDLHAPGFSSGTDDDGSMVNPRADGLQALQKGTREPTHRRRLCRTCGTPTRSRPG